MNHVWKYRKTPPKEFEKFRPLNDSDYAIPTVADDTEEILSEQTS